MLQFEAAPLNEARSNRVREARSGYFANNEGKSFKHEFELDCLKWSDVDMTPDFSRAKCYRLLCASYAWNEDVVKDWFQRPGEYKEDHR